MNLQPATREGKRFFEGEPHKDDVILPEIWYYCQKNNVNPDGSHNMVRTKTWGRFNQCFISSGTGFKNALYSWKQRQGHIRMTTGNMDELAYQIVLTNHLHGVTTKDNPDRYFWEHHCNLNNEFLHGSFENPGEVYFRKLNSKNLHLITQELDAGRQPLFSIFIGDYYAGARGHIVTAGGHRTINGKLEGLYLVDPAGNLLSKNSYRDNEHGFMNYIPKVHFPKIFRSNHIIMYRDR